MIMEMGITYWDLRWGHLSRRPIVTCVTHKMLPAFSSFFSHEVIFLLDKVKGNWAKLSEVYVEGNLTNIFAVPLLAADCDRSLHTPEPDGNSTVQVFVAAILLPSDGSVPVHVDEFLSAIVPA